MKRLVALVMLLALSTSTLISPAQASLGVLDHVIGLVTTPISVGFGAVRGGLSNGLHSDLVDQFPSILTPITLPVGMVFGTGLGAVAGSIRGLHDGLHCDPLTAESFSLAGDFLDYDPYHI